jgi:Na+/alanine symporter
MICGKKPKQMNSQQTYLQITAFFDAFTTLISLFYAAVHFKTYLGKERKRKACSMFLVSTRSHALLLRDQGQVARLPWCVTC